jgi:virginiamycin B lyase
MFVRMLAGPVVVAALIAATAAAQEKVEFFDVPDGAHPHDVSPAPDGKVWYTAQRQGALGILDPTTGAVEQVPLGEGSAPHGVITGPDGKAWITDGGQNAIVSFDPKTREVAVHPLPEDTGYSNLNTAAFAPDGTLWFTGQNGIYGRLDPDSGDMRVFDAPRGGAPMASRRPRTAPSTTPRSPAATSAASIPRPAKRR